MSSTHRYHSLRAQHTDIIHSELNTQISFTQSSTHRYHSLRAQHTDIIHSQHTDINSLRAQHTEINSLRAQHTDIIPSELNTQISFTQSSTHRDHSLRAQHTEIIPSELNTQISFTQSSTHRYHSLRAQHTDIIHSELNTQRSFTQSSTHRHHSLRAQHTDIIHSELNTQISLTQSSTHRLSFTQSSTHRYQLEYHLLNKIPLSVVAYFPVCLCALNNLIFCVPGVISSPNSTMNISRIVTGLFLAGVLVLCLSEAGPVPGGRIKRSESPSPKNLCGDKLCVCKCPDGDHCNISECSNSKDCWVICA